MSTFKKLLALTLALAMVLSVSAFAGYKADTYKDAASIDEDAADAIELLYALEIMKGDENGNFNATATITRAELAKMIYVVLNHGKDDKAVNYTGAKLFSDVPAGVWYEGYVNFMATTKLAQGDGKGNFNPNAPITCAEAAKLMLTAIGYSAEARGYTGANWDKNVLSDAAILGLLEGYKYNTNTYAPRQWVAVMFANMLDCYTFTTMRPTFSGLLTSGEDSGYDTMGGKYYGLVSFTRYAIATNKAYIDTAVIGEDDDGKDVYSTYAAKNYVMFSNGTQVKGTGLGAMDLGQQYRVICKATDDGYVAYSVRNTGKSVVGDAMVNEITEEFTYSAGASSREFTIGDLVAPFDDATINAFGNVDAKPAAYTKFEEKDLMKKLVKNCNDMVRAIDKDADGDIDYLIFTYSDYAEITKVSDDQSGDYITMKYGTNPIWDKAKEGKKQWLGDTVQSEDELSKGNIVKRTWNIDEQIFDLEVLEVVNNVKYTKKAGTDSKVPVYTIGDEEYRLASKGFTTPADMKPLKGEKVTVVYDGELAVYVGEYAFYYTDMEDIYAQLTILDECIDINHPTKNRNVDGVAYWNMDPELLEEVYGGKDENYTTLKTVEIGDGVAHLFALDYDTDENEADLALLKGKSIEDVRKALSADEDLIKAFKTGRGTLNASTDAFKFTDERSYSFAEDAKFFVVSGTMSKPVVEVMTIADVEDTAKGVYAELFYGAADKNGKQYILGGLVDLRKPALEEDDGYFFVLDFEAVDTEAKTQEVEVMFTDGTELTINLDVSNDLVVEKANALYHYGLKYDEDRDEVYSIQAVAGGVWDNADKGLMEGAYFDFTVNADGTTTDTGAYEIAINDIAWTGEIVASMEGAADKVYELDEDTLIALTIKVYDDDKTEAPIVEHFFTDIEGLEAILDENTCYIIDAIYADADEVDEFYTCNSDFLFYGDVANICIYAADEWN